MTAADTRSIGYRVYDAINAQDMVALDELFDPNIVRHAAGETGIEKARKALSSTFASYPETHFVVEDLISEGSKVALRVTVHGRPTAPGDPLPTILEIFRIENGRVAEIWGAGTLRPSKS